MCHKPPLATVHDVPGRLRTGRDDRASGRRSVTSSDLVVRLLTTRVLDGAESVRDGPSPSR